MIELRVRRTVKRSVQNKNNKKKNGSGYDRLLEQGRTPIASYLSGGGLEIKKILRNFPNQDLASQLNQDFFQGNSDIQNKAIRKKLKPYSNTKVKARNFISNIVYRQFKDSDFKKDNFVKGVFPFLIQSKV